MLDIVYRAGGEGRRLRVVEVKLFRGAAKIATVKSLSAPRVSKISFLDRSITRPLSR